MVGMSKFSKGSTANPVVKQVSCSIISSLADIKVEQLTQKHVQRLRTAS